MVERTPTTPTAKRAQALKAGSSAGERLTRAALLRMEIFPPAPPVAPYVTTFFRLRCDEKVIRDVHPSSLGLIAVMARGTGQIRFIDGRTQPSHPFTVITPTNAAATFELDGPWSAFGAMLSPLGWASLTGLSAEAHGNQLLEGSAVLSRELVDAGNSILAGIDQFSEAEMIELLSVAILQSLRPLPAGHAEFVKLVADWLAESLSPNIDELNVRCGYSGRHVQRLTERYFGLPPSALARKYRALRAAVLLSRPSLSADEVAAVQDHFYDQSHMIREMRLFAGRTPARIADPDTPYLAAFMDLRDFRKSGPRMAPIPDDLRA
ncbi:helix-turn-helix domain-containing protein [Novosphingobium tardum]|uniref:Helix-turn-helix domain-containing protein n=1 Tax=Novosphingobium tardum TaxID=1538021 RepID=A0ABV8RSZ8_9SPHN